jgi:threonine aldolase
MKGFGSDNHSGIHPVMLNALIECNEGHEPSYGTDQYSEKAIKQFKDLFGAQAETHFVYNGTAANVLSLQAAMERFETVLCSDVSHIHIDECGAPEFFAGKLQPLPSLHGKIIFSEIEKYLIRKGDQHYSQPRVISITQPTELGTCYTLDEIKQISALAKKHGLLVHIDGARITNAVYFLNTTFRAMVTDAGVDIISVGGTKNGFAFGEAVVILNKDLQKDFKFIRKQAAQLPSKSRFIANQFSCYFQDENYLKIAAHSMQMAALLHTELEKICQTTDLIKITQPRQSNVVFVIIPKSLVKPLRENFFFYVWDESSTECRLMTSWDTTADDVHGFILKLKSLI